MILETEYGWVLVENRDILYIKMDLYKIHRLFIIYKNIDKINFNKKLIIAKNPHRISIIFRTSFMTPYNFFTRELEKENDSLMVDINTFFDIEHSVIEWVFGLFSDNLIKAENEDYFEFSIFTMPFSDWASKRKKIKIGFNIPIEIIILKNTINIKYDSKYSSLVYKYINETIDTAKFFKQKYRLKIGEEEIKWNIKSNLANICKLIIKSDNCEIELSEDITYMLDICINKTSDTAIENSGSILDVHTE